MPDLIELGLVNVGGDEEDNEEDREREELEEERLQEPI